jgi:hypothetical protein
MLSNSPMIMTSNLPISLLLLRNITMKMLLHHIYFLHPKLYNRCHRLKMVRLSKPSTFFGLSILLTKFL